MALPNAKELGVRFGAQPKLTPELPENNPLSLEEANRVRVLVNQMEGAERLFLHAMVIPNAPEIAPLQLMKDVADRYPIAAWKCYTQWGPNGGSGFELDSPDVGIPFIERGASSACATSASTRVCSSRGSRKNWGDAQTSAAPQHYTPT